MLNKNNNKKILKAFKTFKIFKIFFSILIFFITSLFFINFINYPSVNNSKKLSNGYIDLSEFNFDNSFLNLQGEWELYYGQTISPEDFKKNNFKAEYEKLMPWGRLDHNDIGVATYRATIKKHPKYTKFAIKLPSVNSTYSIFVNGELKNTYSNTYAANSNLLSNYHYFESESDTIEIVLQVSNLQYFKGGIIKSPTFGISKNIEINSHIELFVLFLFIFCLLFISITIFSFYLAQNNENNLIFLGLATTTILLNIFLSESSSLYFFSYKLPYSALIKSFYIFNIIFTYFVLLYFKSTFDFKKYIYNNSLQFVLIIYAIFIVFLDIKHLHIIHVLAVIINCLSYSYFFISSTIDMFYFKQRSTFNFMGSFILILSFSLDVDNLIISPYYIIGLLLFSLFLFVDIIKRYSYSFANLKLIKTNLENQLQDNIIEIKEISNKLNIEVKARTETEEKLCNISNIDQLTGAFTSIYGVNYLESLVSTYLRHSHSFSLLTLNIDNLKDVNDTFGRLKGDKVLIETTIVINSLLRRTDVLSRFGGDEFLIIMPNCTNENAINVAEKLRSAISFNIIDGVGCVTVSIGIASILFDDDSKSILNRATNNLNIAKNLGKNSTYASDI